MNVVQILYSGLGGHGSVAFALAQAARGKHGWSNCFLFLGTEPVLPSYQATCGASDEPYLGIRTRRGAPWLAWPSIYRGLRRLRPDAVILHSVKAIMPCALYARRHRIPLIAVEHQSNALKSRAEWWASRQLQRFSDAVVVLTVRYRDELELALGRHWNAAKVHLIPTGVDTAIFSPAHGASRRPAEHTIGMAARMTSIKRQDLLIDAIAQLNTAEPGRWRLSLAGGGDTLEALRAYAKSRGMQEFVEFPGYLDEAKMVSWFRKIDIYAHASEGETLSTSLLQASAMGLPVVGSDVAGIGDLIESSGGAGIPVAQTPGAFASAFRRLAADADLARSMGAKGREFVLGHFSLESMAASYDRLVRSPCAR